MAYNWQHKSWPRFTFDLSGVEEKLYAFSEKTGLIGGILKALPEDTQTEAIIETMVSEAIKTSEIEGEYLSRKDVMSSIKNDLGLNPKHEPVLDKRSKGVGQLMIEVRETYPKLLTKAVLFLWHKMLFGTGSGIKIGTWRDHREPMQVISGALGKEKIHFEAPPF